MRLAEGERDATDVAAAFDDFGDFGGDGFEAALFER